MKLVRSLKQQMFDIRPGEHLRTWAMFFYLLAVLFAYYVLKPVSRSMFLTKFDVDQLPSLYILIAVFGGIFAYLYSKLAAKSSLRTAVFWTMALSVLSLVAMWALIHLPWMIYVLNIWVSLFSIVLVSQGWLVAGNIFDAREAKRLYPLLGMGMVLGAAFGGEFTNRTALLLGTRNLLLASAAMVILAYLAFRLATSDRANSLKQARASDAAETDFSFGGMVRDISRTRHLQVIVGLMVVMYLVDTLVEYQFQVTAKQGHSGDQLTAFFGQFYGLYLNLTEFVFQLFVTAFVVRRFGVGGTLQIAPTTILLSSVATAVSTSLTAAGAVRLAEASTRYTLNRTGMELLYMPLPQELRNRIKAFIDICVDRLARGLGGVLLLLLTTTSLDLGVRGISIVVMGLCIPWMYFSYLARKEYVTTIRKRFEARRLDFETARVSVSDSATIRMLEETAKEGNVRQATYALSLLAEAPKYDVRPRLLTLATNPATDLRSKVYEVATTLKYDGVLEQAAGELRTAQADPNRALPASAIPYLLAMAPERRKLAAELLDSPNPMLVASALDALRADQELADELITREWLQRTANSGDSLFRALAAKAIGVRGDHGIDLLHPLFEDPDGGVVREACRAAGFLRNRAYLFALTRALENPRLRADAISALAAYGHAICGMLSDVLLDDEQPIRVRTQVPRVLKRIPDQRSVDVLLSAVGHRDLSIRAAVLKALNHLRETTRLNFENTFVTEQIRNEARYYYELSAALAPFREREAGEHTAARLLARTIEERLKSTLERLFRLLGLNYPPKEIYSVYQAVSRQRHEEATAALEFLDNTLDPNLKRILLPLLDAPENLSERGRELFDIEMRTAEDAIRDLIRSHDPWLVACSMAAAAELNLRSLAPEIAQAAEDAAEDVSEVARSAEAVLAA